MKILILALMSTISLSAFAKADSKFEMDKTNILVFNGFINTESTTEAFNKLKEKSKKLKGKEPLFLIVNSTGGELAASNEFIKNCKTLGRPVHTVTMVAAGAAFHIVQGLDTRYAVNESLFILTPIRSAGFDMQKIKDIVFKGKYEKAMKAAKEVNTADAKRIGVSLELYESLAKDEFCANTADAAKLGMYDELMYFTNGVMLHNFILRRKYEN